MSELYKTVSGGDAEVEESYYLLSPADFPDYADVLQDLRDDQVLLLEETQLQSDILMELKEFFIFETEEADAELAIQDLESVSGGDAVNSPGADSPYYVYSSAELPDYTKMFQELSANQQLIIKEFQTQTKAINEQTEHLQQGFVMQSIILGIIAGMFLMKGLWSGRR